MGVWIWKCVFQNKSYKFFIDAKLKRWILNKKLFQELFSLTIEISSLRWFFFLFSAFHSILLSFYVAYITLHLDVVRYPTTQIRSSGVFDPRYKWNNMQLRSRLFFFLLYFPLFRTHSIIQRNEFNSITKEEKRRKKNTFVEWSIFLERKLFTQAELGTLFSKFFCFLFLFRFFRYSSSESIHFYFILTKRKTKGEKGIGCK